MLLAALQPRCAAPMPLLGGLARNRSGLDPGQLTARYSAGDSRPSGHLLNKQPWWGVGQALLTCWLPSRAYACKRRGRPAAAAGRMGPCGGRRLPLGAAVPGAAAAGAPVRPGNNLLALCLPMRASASLAGAAAGGGLALNWLR